MALATQSTQRKPAAGRALALLTACAVVLGASALTSPARAATPVSAQLDLKVLVLTDGATPAEASAPVSAIEQQLSDEGVPFTSVQLGDASRPAITESYLSETVGGVAHARFQGVVVPYSMESAPVGSPVLSADELTALHSFERTFGVRQVTAYTWANPTVGLNYATNPGFVGTLDGMDAQVSASGLAGAFRNLKGKVPVDDVDPAVMEAYGYLATPLPADPVTGSSFEPLVTATIPTTTTDGVLAGVHSVDGREDLVLTFAYNYWQTHFRLLAPGIVEWLTGGVHLGTFRNNLAVHVDDVLGEDSRWDATGNCTPGEGDCATGYTPPAGFVDSFLMTPADVDYLVKWQNDHGFKLDLVFNGKPSEDRKTTTGTADPLTDAMVAAKSSLRWINHTYSHQYLGCTQDFSVTPWACVTNASGIVYMPTATVKAEITNNTAWATTNGITLNPSELVSGEHSGLKSLPQMTVDSSNFISAIQSAQIATVASDASREPDQRKVGPALTVPRYPMTLYYNTAKAAEMADEYNWFYAAAPEGSGLCGTNCITPLGSDGFASYIVPREVRSILSRILNNDPRPHFVHQGNLTEDRLIYKLLDGVLERYATLTAANTPLLQPTLTESATELERQASWKAISSTVTASMRGGQVVIKATQAGWVPFSATEAMKDGTPWGDSYAGTRSAWKYLAANESLTVDVAANQLPTASFTSNCVDLTCTADATASADPEGAVLTYAWDFGDGTAKAAGVIPAAHTYAAAGAYKITLTVTDARGGSATTTKDVTVVAPKTPPTAVIKVDCKDLTCTVDGSGSSDADGTVSTYQWSFGDNASDTGSKPKAHVYPAAGSYTITLTVTDNDGKTGTTTQAVKVTAPPKVKPTAAFTQDCTGLTCAFDGSGSTDSDGHLVSYLWNYGDGSSGTGPSPDFHKYVLAGTYSVTLTVYDNDNLLDVATHEVTVKAPVTGGIGPVEQPTTPTPTDPTAGQSPSPAPTTPAPTAAQAGSKVSVKAVSGKSKLFVDVNPNKGKGYWTFKVQYRKSGQWQTLPKTYRTQGNKETRTINLKKGTYRVVVGAKYQRAATTSSQVKLLK